MKRVILAALTCMAVTGCATAPGLRKDAPDVTIVTMKSPVAYGQCVGQGWGDFFGVSVNQTSTPDGGYTVTMPNAYTGNNGVMDVTKDGHVTVHYRLGSLGGYGKFTKVIQACA